MIYLAFASAVAIMLPSLVGVFFVRRGPAAWMARNIHYLASFSIGIFGILAWRLGSEAVEHAGFSEAALAALIGAGAIALIARIIPDAHHHHEVAPHGEGNPHTRIDARRLLVSDGVHNMTDGFMLVPAYLVSPVTGLIATGAIFVHELVQETAKFFVLKEAGYSNRQAIVRSVISASSILIGVAASALLASTEGAESILIAIAAGGFLYLILRDLVPNAVQSIRNHGNIGRHALAIALGVAIMLAVSIAAPHGHEEEAGHDDEKSAIIEE